MYRVGLDRIMLELDQVVCPVEGKRGKLGYQLRAEHGIEMICTRETFRIRSFQTPRQSTRL